MEQKEGHFTQEQVYNFLNRINKISEERGMTSKELDMLVEHLKSSEKVIEPNYDENKFSLEQVVEHINSSNGKSRK